MALFSRFAASTPMMGFNFTERVRRILAMAREEAARLHHEYVGTEHVLLAIVAEGQGVGATVLQRLGVDLAALRATIVDTVKHGSAAVAIGPDLPYTSRAKKALEFAMAEARELNHSYVGSEHLVLGLLREGRGIAGQVLVDSGATFDRVRAETLRVLTEAPPNDSERAAFVERSAPAPAPFSPRTSLEMRTEEALAWARLQHALDATAKLGAVPSIALEPDGTLSVSLGSELVVSVEFPNGVRVRPRPL